MQIPCHIAMTRKAIDIADIYSQLDDSGSGAAVVFVGRVRETNEGRLVRGIAYSAYESMAVAECLRIWAEACSCWSVRRGVMRHRLGRLPVGAVSIAVGIAAAHRAEAFAAAQFCIDRFKASVPIWKEEGYIGGVSAWITNTPSVSPEGRAVDSDGTRQASGGVAAR